MPVIKIFCPEVPAAPRHQEMAQTLRALCLQEMKAEPHAIQIMLVRNVLVLDGEPLMVEAHYRDRPDRQGDALKRFLAGVDQAVQLAFGQKPRIRSFAVDPSTLGAVR